MIPTIVARKIASSCQAGFVTPEGTGTNQRMTPVAIDASNGFIAAPCHGSEAGVIDAGADDSDEAFTVKLEIPRVVDVTLDLDNFGSEGETVESFGRFGREGRGFCEVDRRRDRERDLRQAWELKEREEDWLWREEKGREGGGRLALIFMEVERVEWKPWMEYTAPSEIFRVGLRNVADYEWLGFPKSIASWRCGLNGQIVQGSDIVTTDVDKASWIWGGGGGGGRERGRQRPNRRSETVFGGDVCLSRFDDSSYGGGPL
ncbi:hypothetical protein OIU78_018934 [Salix suchowensis]|nr:hypothetical protein OIU78_018934 [Salix suchowensis]